MLMVVACGSSSPPAHQPAPKPADADQTCPMEVPGTSVSEEDSDRGAALVFTTTGDAVELQTRCDTFEAFHQTKDVIPGQFAAMIKTPSSVISIHRAPLPANVVRLEFGAKDPAQIGALQSELRMHASMLTAGTCKMAM